MKEESLKVRKMQGDVTDELEGDAAVSRPQKDIFGLTPSMSRFIIALFIFNAFIGIASYAWQVFTGLKEIKWAAPIVFWVLDVIIAYAVSKKMPWARVVFVIRALAGISTLFLLGAVEGQYVDPISQLIVLSGIGILLTGKIEESLAKFLGYALFLFVGYLGYSHFDTLFFREKIVSQLRILAERTYINEKYNFNMVVPDNWIVVERSDFAKVNKSFYKTAAAVALIRLDEKGYALFIPENTENLAYGYDTEYKLTTRKKELIDEIARIEGVQNLSQGDNFLIGNGGFELFWTAYREDGNLYKHVILYGLFDNNLGIKVMAWAQDLDAREVFQQAMKILLSVETR